MKKLIADASLLGYGAHLDEQVAQGSWTWQDSSFTCLLQLQAVLKAYRRLLPFIRALHIQYVGQYDYSIVHEQT